MSGGQSKSRGTARSSASVEHGPGNSSRNREDQIDQDAARMEAILLELSELASPRIAARRAVLTMKAEQAPARKEDELAIQGIDLAFNFDPAGVEISDEEDKRRVREEEQVQYYWKLRGAGRQGKWKSVPLGGDRTEDGQSSSSPVWYLASNMSQWDTWAVIDGTRAGLNGKRFLHEVMTCHAEWFGEFTKHRLIVGQCHKKPHNIHAQHWFSVIGPAIPNPGASNAAIDRQRPAGMLLGREDMRGRGKSPMRFSFLGKTGCSLANLRRAGYDICALTGDPDMVRKLDHWIARRKRNEGVILDMESERKLEEIVASVREKCPEWEPFFVAARKRHEQQKEVEIRRIHEEIAKSELLADGYDLRARLEAEERKNADLRDGTQMIQENAIDHAATNKSLAEQIAAAKAAPIISYTLDRRARIVAMGDALRRTVAGSSPTTLDLTFIKSDENAIGGHTLQRECWDELVEALGDGELKKDAEETRRLVIMSVERDKDSTSPNHPRPTRSVDRESRSG